jgi:hypothetical protein
MENKFKEVMSKRTDEELIKIVSIDKDGYEPLAVEAAKKELEKRKISGDDQLKIKSELQSEENLIPKKDKIDKIKRELSEAYNPLTNETYRRRIILISGFLIVTFIFNLIDNFQLLRNINFSSFEYTLLEPILFLILTPLAGILIWKENKSGWIILVGLLTFYTVIYLFLQISAIVIAMSGELDIYSREGEVKFTIKLILMILFWLYLNSKGLRDYLNISSRITLTTIIISIVTVPIIGLLIFT